MRNKSKLNTVLFIILILLILLFVYFFTIKEKSNFNINATVNNPATSIVVISPNGGEKFDTSTPFTSIPVSWKSSGITSKNVVIYIENLSNSYPMPIHIVPDNGSANISTIPPGNYKIKICATYEKPGNLEVEYVPDCTMASDSSDSFFTVNKDENSVSTILPSRYISVQGDWPPTVKNSSVAYSCAPNSGSGDVFKTIVQKKINGKVYCISSLINAGAGSRFSEYTYTTADGVGIKTTTFNLRWSSCGGYGSPGNADYDQCQATVSNFLGNLDMIIDKIMWN